MSSRTALPEETRPASGEEDLERELPARDELLRLYMAEAAATPLLTAEEEVALARAIAAGNRARERLATLPPDAPEREALAAEVEAG
ncbi:MAG TPA: sigma-70 factor domain-containing protein, partial [Chloroflexota bacterium]|nr:sigma-70 factor domain-containing protein [Chloroflexota bacterium]